MAVSFARSRAVAVATLLIAAGVLIVGIQRSALPRVPDALAQDLKDELPVVADFQETNETDDVWQRFLVVGRHGEVSLSDCRAAFSPPVWRPQPAFSALAASHGRYEAYVSPPDQLNPEDALDRRILNLRVDVACVIQITP